MSTPILRGPYPYPSGPRVILPHDYVPDGVTPAVEWFGAYPYLDTIDGSGSYGLAAGFTQYTIGVVLDAQTLAVGSTLALGFQIQFDFVGTNYPGFGLYDRTVGGELADRLAAVTHPGVEQPGDEWVVGSVDFTVTADIADAAARGDLTFTRSAYNPGGISHMGQAARPIPTRVYPRADGLGMGAPRIMDNRSPYRSARVFGMI